VADLKRSAKKHMPLDFSLMGESGKQEAYVPMELREWWLIVSPTANSELPLLERMSDYYEHATYESTDLPALIAELEAVRKDFAAADKVAADMLALCHKAEEKKATVMAIAD
jgi:hypothetical protein